MRRLTHLLAAGLIGPGVLAAAVSWESASLQERAAATQPTTRPSTQPEGADAALDRLLEPATRATAPSGESALAPAPGGQPDNATGRGSAAVAPDTPRRQLVREGTYVIDRLVQVRRSVDGRGLEAVFVADGPGPAAVDPPMLLAPNLNLQSVEAGYRQNAESRYRVTGRVTEYRGRNYLLLEKVVVLP